MKLFSLFGREKLSPAPPPASPLDEAFERHVKLVREIEDILPGKGADLFRPLALRFAAFVYDLPASQDHHHAERFGLLRHSLETACEAARIAAGRLNLEYLDSGVIDSVKTERNRPRLHYLEALVGFFHDVGKVFDVDVKAGDELWNPGQEGLYGFLERLKATDYQLGWVADRFHRHIHRTVIVLRGIVSDEDATFLGREIFLKALARLITFEASPADVTSVKTGLASPDPEAPRLKEQAFLESVRELVQVGLLKCNRPRGNVYVGREYTFLVAPQPLQVVIEHMRTVKSVYTSRQDDLVDYLHARGLLREKDGRNFLKAEVASSGMPPIVLGGVLIDNVPLWGNAVPALFSGTLSILLDPDFKFNEVGGQGKEQEGTGIGTEEKK